MKKLLYFQSNQNENKEQVFFNQYQQLNNSIDSISENHTSKIYQFENFPEPKNATEGNIISEYNTI
jgi:hypothetical protein